jgi:malate dehydrogenase (oxaloacetate-decarboxylating)
MGQGLMREGLSPQQARERIFVLDSKGLLVEGRAMEPYKQPYAQPQECVAEWRIAGSVPSLLEVIENAQTTVLLGLSGQTGAFNRPVVAAMNQNTTQPVIFPLSNPTSASEALPEDILVWSDGRALVATGSPFPDVNHDGRDYSIGQGNNAFIFPGLGFGAILAECKAVTDDMVLAAATALAEYTAAYHLDAGRVYPPIAELQEVSIRVGARVIEQALAEGVAGRTDLAGRDLDAYLRSRFWRPKYLPFVRGE